MKMKYLNTLRFYLQNILCVALHICIVFINCELELRPEPLNHSDSFFLFPSRCRCLGGNCRPDVDVIYFPTRCIIFCFGRDTTESAGPPPITGNSESLDISAVSCNNHSIIAAVE